MIASWTSATGLLVETKEVQQDVAHRAYRAVPVTGVERERIARDYGLPFAIRFLTGFPPRSFLRLDRRIADE